MLPPGPSLTTDPETSECATTTASNNTPLTPLAAKLPVPAPQLIPNTYVPLLEVPTFSFSKPVEYQLLRCCIVGVQRQLNVQIT